MKNFKILLSVLLFVSAFTFASCSKKSEIDEIFFDTKHPLALAPDVSWAVVVEPYVPYHIESSRESSTAEYCRKGEILQVKGRSMAPSGSWYLFENGWLYQDSVEIYANRYKAEAAAVKYKEIDNSVKKGSE